MEREWDGFQDEQDEDGAKEDGEVEPDGDDEDDEIEVEPEEDVEVEEDEEEGVELEDAEGEANDRPLSVQEKIARARRMRANSAACFAVWLANLLTRPPLLLL